MGCGSSIAPTEVDDNAPLVSLSTAELSQRIKQLSDQPQFTEYASSIALNAVNGAVAACHLMRGDLDTMFDDLGINARLHRTAITAELTSLHRFPSVDVVVDTVKRLGAAYAPYADRIESNAVGGAVISDYLQRDDSARLLTLLGVDEELHTKTLLHVFERLHWSGSIGAQVQLTQMVQFQRSPMLQSPQQQNQMSTTHTNPNAERGLTASTDHSPAAPMEHSPAARSANAQDSGRTEAVPLVGEAEERQIVSCSQHPPPAAQARVPTMWSRSYGRCLCCPS